MEKQPRRSGRIVCVIRGYTVTEVVDVRADGEFLAGYTVFGPGAADDTFYPTPEEVVRVIDRLVDGI